jgi:hypothetical protein
MSLLSLSLSTLQQYPVRISSILIVFYSKYSHYNHIRKYFSSENIKQNKCLREREGGRLEHMFK